MALTACGDCGQMVSTRAVACPGCGCPMVPSETGQAPSPAAATSLSATDVPTAPPSPPKPPVADATPPRPPEPPAAKAAHPVASAAGHKVCVGCSKSNESSAEYCFDCGAPLPTEVAVADPAGDSAGFWVRAAAFGVDVLISIFMDICIYHLVSNHSHFGASWSEYWHLASSSRDWSATDTRDLILNFSRDIAVYTFFVGRWGATIGKLAFGLRIVRSDGGKLPYGLAFMRFLAYFISLLPLGLGFFWAGLSSRKRAWHDYLADTKVIQRRGR